MSTNPSHSAVENIIAVGKRLYERKLIVGTEGNISVRKGPNKFSITRSGTCKGHLNPSEILTINEKGQRLAGDGKGSSETPFHLAIYQARENVTAILHAHPPYAIACTLAGISLSQPFLAETVVALGAIPTLPYCLPGSKEIAQQISDFLNGQEPTERCRVLLLERHGAISMAEDMETAFHQLEILERTAEIVFLAHQIKTIHPLTEAQVKQIEKLKNSDQTN